MKAKCNGKGEKTRFSLSKTTLLSNKGNMGVKQAPKLTRKLPKHLSLSQCHHVPICACLSMFFNNNLVVLPRQYNFSSVKMK